MLSRNTQILDTLVTGIVVLDGQLRISQLNAAAEALLQTSTAHALGQPLQEIILRAEKIIVLLHQALLDGQPFTEREATVRLPDNQSISVDLTVTLLEDNQAQRSLILELQPLNRLKRINKDDESVARQETASRLVRGLAHEIKNPLGGIRGAAQLLERELPNEDLREYTGVIISEADRLKELVDRMLGPQRQLEMKPVNILRVFERVIQLIEVEQPGRINWRRDYDPSLPYVAADESQLIQAVLNIVRNACQALQHTEDARIHLRSRAVRQFTIGTIRHRLVMQLDIVDNGPGIDPELGERIFFPMISGRADGTGLGLAITQSIVAQHKGSIQANSKPGQTSFSIYLPFAQLDGSQKDQQDSQQAQADTPAAVLNDAASTGDNEAQAPIHQEAPSHE